jgi:hypothetical protein
MFESDRSKVMIEKLTQEQIAKIPEFVDNQPTDLRLKKESGRFIAQLAL